MNLIDVWQQAQASIQERIGTHSYETWLSTLTVNDNGSVLTVETPDDFFKNWIIDNYLGIITEEVRALSTPQVSVEVAVTSSSSGITTLPTPLPTPEPVAASISPDRSLNPRFTFNNFVVGPSNRFACAACQAVAESPAKAYNPLFLYGKVGLGKTHLMQAITHQIQTNHPNAKYSYTTSERFTNELIDAIRHRSTSQFRQKYRNIDVLLIDDIHFIAGKESTQEEFFHTFNALHNSRKQIIISSDRPPKEIANLEERLSSRFAWGLITDIQPPDYETRVAILRKKSEKEPVSIPEDVLSFIAEQIKSNIRELEGALIRVVAYSLLEEKPISLELAKIVLKDMVREVVKTIKVESVQKIVAEHFHVTISDLKSKGRSRAVIFPRQVAMYLTRTLTNMSLPEIGKAFGGKDHTTVLHSCKKIEKDIDKQPGVKDTVEKVLRDIKQ